MKCVGSNERLIDWNEYNKVLKEVKIQSAKIATYMSRRSGSTDNVSSAIVDVFNIDENFKRELSEFQTQK